MSSGTQPTSVSLWLNDCMTVTMITAVGYDYILTLSREIEYIWCKPRSWVTVLFVLVRYAGLCTITKQFSTWTYKDDLIGAWTFLAFLVSADIVMMLRVWAMYARSRLVFCILLMSLLVEILFIAVDIIIDDPPENVPAVTVQMLTFSFYVGFGSSPVPSKLAPVSQIVHGALTCILAIVQFGRDARQTYHATRRLQVNRYVDLLVKQGVLYFLFILGLSLVAALAASGQVPREGWRAMVLMIFEFVPLYTLTPRFVISVRELYERDVQGRRGEGIDTGFGLSLSSSAAERSVGEAAMVFADVGQEDGGGRGRGTGDDSPSRCFELLPCNPSSPPSLHLA